MAKRFESLDGMRGICALTVALLHFDSALRTGHLLNYGWLSVDVFFVLSGFVLSVAFEDKLRAGMPVREFIRARAIRLIPTQWIGTGITALATIALYLHGDMSLPNMSVGTILTAVLFALLLLPISISPVARIFSYMPKENFPINPALWSLQGEWFINILYSEILYTLRFPSLLLIYLGPAAFLIDIAPDGEWIGVLPGLARATAGFIAGIVIYRAMCSGVLKSLPIIRPEILYAVWFVVCVTPANAPRPIFQCAAALGLAPLMVALLVRAERPMARPFIWLGGLSYPLYASHIAIQDAASLLLPRAHSHSALWAIPMVATALALAWIIN